MEKISVIIPAKDEAAAIAEVLAGIKEKLPSAEILVIDDASSDNTAAICRQCNIKVIQHPYPKGNGAAIKTGARHASGNILIFMDADGQHDNNDLPRLLEKFHEGYDMVIGARNRKSQANLFRAIANRFYNSFASWMTGFKIKDLTSGYRIVQAKKFKEFLALLPNSFSYPTTITMAFLRAGYSITYIDIEAKKRLGKSHISPLKDGFRFLLIILKIGTLYSPLKLFLPIAIFHFLTGISYYSYTYIRYHQFTNMSALLLTTSILIFLIGLISEQISSLLYSQTGKEN